MEEEQLSKILNALASRCVVLECQLLALRRILDRSQIVPGKEFDMMLESALAAYKELLDPEKAASERLAEFLRAYKGPIQ